MGKASFQLDPDAVAYTDDEIVGKINTATADITRTDSVSAAARPIAAGEIGATELENEAFLAAEKTKLTGIEENATVDQTGTEIKTAYEAEANAYTDTKDTKLSGIDEGAKDDQTGTEIKTAYEGEANTYNDTKDTKLTSIEESATADQDGAEVRDLVVALADTERKIVITDPQTGEFPVIAIQRDSTGRLDIDYDDVATT